MQGCAKGIYGDALVGRERVAGCTEGAEGCGGVAEGLQRGCRGMPRDAEG